MSLVAARPSKPRLSQSISAYRAVLGPFRQLPQFESCSKPEPEAIRLRGDTFKRPQQRLSQITRRHPLAPIVLSSHTIRGSRSRCRGAREFRRTLYLHRAIASLRKSQGAEDWRSSPNQVRSRTRRRCLDPCGQPLFRLAASRCLRPASRREMPAPAPSRWQDSSRVQRLRGLVGQLMGLSSSRCLGWIVKPRALGVKQAQRCLASGAQGLPRGTSLASSFLPRLSGTAEPCAVAKRSGQRHEDFRQAQRIKRL